MREECVKQNKASLGIYYELDCGELDTMYQSVNLQAHTRSLISAAGVNDRISAPQEL